MHNNVSELSELGPEGLVERLNKGELFQDFDFLKSYVIGNREIGGVHSGITRNRFIKCSRSKSRTPNFFSKCKKEPVKYPFHHVTQIAGGVPLTSDDVAIINQRMNSVMSKYDQDLNRIAEAIQKNNRLALEAMNAKDEGSAFKIYVSC